MTRLGMAFAAVLITAAPAYAEPTKEVAARLIRHEDGALRSVRSNHLNKLLVPVTANGPQAAPRNGQPLSKAELQCLSEALYFEARGETLTGQKAVAEVILNRVDSARYPDTVCEVVNQGTGRLHACQFSYTCDGKPEEINEPKAWERVRAVAKTMLTGAARTLTGGATHYHTTAVAPRWSRVYAKTATIGYHRFYRQTARISTSN